MAGIPFLSSTPRMSTTSKLTNYSNECSGRKTLQTIQPSADNKFTDHHSECRDSISKHKKMISSDNKHHHVPLQTKVITSSDIYHDAGTSVDCQTDNSLLEALLEERQLRPMNVSTDSGHQSGFLDQEAFDLMGNESIPDRYWKDIAEERRLALQKTLEENKELHDEVNRLKEENGRLSNLAHKAEELQLLLNTVLSEDDDDDADEPTGEATKEVKDTKQDSQLQDDLTKDKEST